MSVTETPTPTPAVVRISGSNFSLRVIAGAIILLFCYYAQGVVITLLLSILLAYFLDPAVEILERAGIPRTAGAMVLVAPALRSAGAQALKPLVIGGSVPLTGAAAETGLNVNNGYITAANTPQDQKYGYVFSHATITGEPGVLTYLGRPWRAYAATVFLNTEMSTAVRRVA